MIIKKLPKDWKSVKFGNIAKFIDYRGKTPKKTESGIPLITAKNVKMGYINENPKEFIAEDDYEKWMTRGIPNVGDILFTTEAPMGNVAQLKTNAKIALAQRMITFQTYDGLINTFLKYNLMSPQFQNTLNSKGTGTTVKGIKASILKQFEIPLPPLETQNAIVSKIEELFSDIDKGVEDIKIAQQQLKTYRQSVLKWAFEGKLTNENVKDGELPNGWKMSKIGDVCHNVEYGSGSKSQKEGKIPVLRMGNIQNGIFDWNDLVYSDDEKEIDRYLLRKNDVLFNRTNSAELVGKTAIYKGEKPAIFAGYLIRINRIEELIDATYLTYYLNSKDARAYGNSVRSFGVNQSNINGTKLKTYPLPLPKIDEQVLIVQEIESRLSVAEKMEETINESLKQAEALRQSILKKAFSGELIKEVVQEKVYKPKNEYFFQMQIIGKIASISKKNKIEHGEMTIAKYTYLADKLFGIATGFEFNRWHLGPYPPAIKKVVNNKQYFQRTGNHIEVVNESTLFKSTNDYTALIDDAVSSLVGIFSKYKTPAERAHKTELLATVCKVIEDIKTTDLMLVRASMKEWKIDLKTSAFKNKAEKFSEEETNSCIGFIVGKGWDKKLGLK